MSNILTQALTRVCDELERHDPNASALHFARGILAAQQSAPPPAIDMLMHGNRKGLNLTMDDVIADYQAGATLMELGAKYSVSYMTIQRRLVDCGVHLRPRTCIIDRDTPAIAAAYQSGASVADIAKQFGHSTALIYKALRAANVPYRPRIGVGRKPINTQRDQAMIEMRKRGSTLDEIAAKYGMSRQRVHQIVAPAMEKAA